MVAKVIRNQIENIEYREKNIIRVLFSLFIILLVSYGFLVNASTMNGVRKQALNDKVSTLNSEINSLEFSYLNAKNAITLDLAINKGFVPVKNERYLAVSPVQNGLSLLTNGKQ